MSAIAARARRDLPLPPAVAPRARRRAPLLAALAATIPLGLATACASAPPRELQVRGEMAAGRYREAAARAARSGDELLRHLDRGLALFHAGEPRASNLYLARAEQLVEERYTRSLSLAALSLLANDTVLPYQPDAFERLLLPFYRALNHVAAGEAVDAAVEARRLAAALLARRDRDPESAAGEGGAFLSYAAGVLLEWAGRPDEARIAYRNAADSYAAAPGVWIPPGPEPLAGRAVSTGTTPERVPQDPRAEAEPRGELVIFVEGGFVAAPVDERIFLLLDAADLGRARTDVAAAGAEIAKRHLRRRAREDEAGSPELAYLLPVALPRRPAVALPPRAVTVLVDGQPVEAPVALDVSGAAALAWDAALPELLAKTAARALTKWLLLAKPTEDEGAVVRVLANALHVATERADTRAWTSLPGEIRLVRLALLPGAHEVQVRCATPGGPRTLTVRDVRISPGRVTLLSLRHY